MNLGSEFESLLFLFDVMQIEVTGNTFDLINRM